MSSMMTIGILLLFGVIGLIAYLVNTYNTFVRLSNNIDKGWSNIDVILKQRYDELPKLVDVCNSYMAHERETLEAVAKARAAYEKSMRIDDKARAENQLTSVGIAVRGGGTVPRSESESGVPPRPATHLGTREHHCRLTRVL